MAEQRLCHEPIGRGHYCHKPEGHVSRKDPQFRSPRERRESLHICNCKGIPSLEATKAGE